MIPLTLKELEQSVRADSEREQTMSIAAACLGLCLSVALMTAIIALAFSSSLGLVAIPVAIVIFHTLPAWIARRQHHLMYAGKTLLSETIGYLGVGITVPSLVALSPEAASPALGLAGLYAEQGRFNWAVPLARLAVGLSPLSPRLSNYYKISRRASLMRILFDAGNYNEALAIGSSLIQETEANFNASASSENRSSILSVQPLVARLLRLTGETKESTRIWERVCKLNEEQTGEKINSMLLAHRASFIAYAAVRMHDFPAAIKYSEVADRCCKLVKTGSKALAGCVEEHWSLALLESGNLEEAEEHAEKSQAEWSGFLPATAARMAECLYVRGRVNLMLGQNVEAQDFLSRSVAIRRQRYGAQHPELAMTLEPYSKCLRALGRSVEAKTAEMEMTAIKAFHTGKVK